MEVTYLSHSGVCVETGRCVLLFDYYRGEIPEFGQEKFVYVFASHRHPDHFSEEIFKLAEQYPNVTYLLSSDIRLPISKEKGGKEPPEALKVIRMGAGQERAVGDILVRTLKSTDAGVAFLVKAEGDTVYHAGDLNWWHWNGESKAYNRNMEVNYKCEIDKIQKEQVKAAFLPLDPRLEDAYDKGIRYFMETVDCDFIFPIHMWDDYEVIGKLKKNLPDILQKKVMEISHTNQHFVI